MSEPAASATEQSQRRVLAGTLGAALEWYDFTLYVYLAPVIAVLFFPSSSTIDSLLATFGVFAGGYLARPLGAAVIGSYGDRHGRRAALVLSVSVMAAGMVVITALPTEATIGLAAPLILMLVRVAQGFSLGGEFGGAITLLAEAAPSRRRGWVVNFAQISAGAGTLLSSTTIVVLNLLLTHEQVRDFGWRIPFALGALLGLAGVIALLRTPESEAFEQEAEEGRARKSPVADLFESERRPLLLSCALNGYQSLSYYVIVTFVPTFLISFQGADPEEGVLAGVVAAIVFAAGSPLAGGLSDRLGRRPVLAGGLVAMVALAAPLFVVFTGAALLPVLAAQLVLMAVATLFSGSALPVTTELFTTETRYTGTSLSFNVGATVFGGTAPLIATGLIKLLDTDMAPALMLVGAALLTLPVLLLVPETAPVRISPGAGDGSAAG